MRQAMKQTFRNMTETVGAPLHSQFSLAEVWGLTKDLKK